MKKIYEKKIDLVILVILCIVFLGCIILVPMTELGDSFQYLTQLPSRDPVYALLLKIMQTVFADYRLPLSILQNVLAVICIYWFYRRIAKLYGFGNLQRVVTIVILLAPHIITPLASVSRMVITCSVLTEGIAFSLYYVWSGIVLSELLGYYGKDTIKSLYVLLVMSTFMTMIRGQFLVCIAVWLITAIYVLVKRREFKAMIILLIAFMCCFFAKGELTKIYHYTQSGVYTSTVASKPMLLSNIIYVANDDDVEAIDDVRLRQAFLTMLHDAKAKELTSEYSSGSIIDRAKFHEYGHETINFDCVTMELNELIYEFDNMDESTYRPFLVLRDKYAGLLINATIGEVFERYIGNFFVISSLGFVRSISVDRGILVYYALVMYILAIISTIILFVKNQDSRAAHFMAFSLVVICGTVFGTSLMIECLSRYMIYNLPLFYIAGLAVLGELKTALKRKN